MRTSSWDLQPFAPAYKTLQIKVPLLPVDLLVLIKMLLLTLQFKQKLPSSCEQEFVASILRMQLKKII